MTALVLVLAGATAAGLLSRLLRVPPLAGYVAAGFCLGYGSRDSPDSTPSRTSG